MGQFEMVLQRKTDDPHTMKSTKKLILILLFFVDWIFVSLYGSLTKQTEKNYLSTHPYYNYWNMYQSLVRHSDINIFYHLTNKGQIEQTTVALFCIVTQLSSISFV
jgi:hypothetical protein